MWAPRGWGRARPLYPQGGRGGGKGGGAGRYPLVANMRVSDLVRSAGGLLRSANPTSADLTHYAATSGASPAPQVQESHFVNLSAALTREEAEDLPLRDGDVLTVPQQTGWKNIGASVTIRGEVGKPAVYGIQPGERLSSVLRRAGGLLPTAYPQAAVFERIDVREMQQKSRQELIQRLGARRGWPTRKPFSSFARMVP